MTDPKNVFEAQYQFLRAVKYMVDEEEIYLDGTDAIGFETLLEEYESKAAKITTKIICE